MKQRFFSVKLYVEGIRQLKVVGVIFLIIATLVNCILPLIELLVKAGVFEMESPTTEASALDMSQFTFILVVLAAIIMTFNLFKFLNKRSGSDFYHSLPVTRPCLFFSLCASVLTVVVFVFAIPILLAGLLYVIAGVKFLWDISALCLLSYALCALLLMACTLFGMSLTGTFISGFMMGLIVFLLPRILIMVYTSLLNNLTVIADVQTLNIFTYPAYNLPVNLCLSFFSITSMSWAEAICFLPGMLYTAVLGFVYLAVACLLFTFRKSETAEQSAPNRILQHIYRCIVALPISLTLPAIIVPAIVEGRAGIQQRGAADAADHPCGLSAVRADYDKETAQSSARTARISRCARYRRDHRGQPAALPDGAAQTAACGGRDTVGRISARGHRRLRHGFLLF